MEEKMGKANEQAKDKPSLLNRWLNGIEKVGNKLPHPISIFAILVLFVIVLSAVCEMAGVSATGPAPVFSSLRAIIDIPP